MAKVSLVSTASALVLAAGAAQADIIKAPQPQFEQAPQLNEPAPGQAGGYVRTGNTALFNVAGIPSFGSFGNPNNTVINLNLGAGAIMNGVGWDVTLFADQNVGTFGGSWLSELTVTFSDSAGGQGISLRPGAGSDFSGTASFASGGVIKFSTVPLPDIILADGILRMEFSEAFADDETVPDGMWQSGNLTIQYVPAPGAMALFGMGGLLAARRRRA